MLPGVDIRPAMTSDDLSAVVGLFSAYEASLGIDLSYQNFTAELAGLPGQYAPPGGALLLARAADGSAVGCVALRSLRPDVCEMKRLYVAPGGRGMGIGRALMSGIVERARGLGYGEIRLDTLPDMTAAQALYRDAGFEPIPFYYETPVADTVFLRLVL